MYELQESAVAKWSKARGHAVPSAIDTVCHACSRSVTLTADNWNDYENKGLPKTTRCPRCGTKVDVIRLGGLDQKSARIYVDAAQPSRPPLAGIGSVPEDVLSRKLKREYQSALNVLAIGEAEATAITCRRVLEGITWSLVPPDNRKGSLYKNLQELANNTEMLAKPILELANLLRTEGNAGAHFDEAREVTVDDAKNMMDLLEFLLQYLFIIPNQVDNFTGGEGSDQQAAEIDDTTSQSDPT